MNGERVHTLLEALPYIREFHGQTVVIKYGGAAMTDPELREEFARDVVLLKYVGLNPIVVHGGGPDITAYMQRLDMPVEFVGGLRVSDADTVEIAKMVLVGKVNKDIVLRLGRHGQPAAAEAQHDVLVDLAHEHHLGHLDRGRVGHAQPADELHRQAEPLHVAGDIRATAVHDDRVHADVLEQHDVAGELLPQRRVAHGRTAVLDHHRAAVELPDVGERLEQRLHVAQRSRHYVVYSALMVTYWCERSEKSTSVSAPSPGKPTT